MPDLAGRVALVTGATQAMGAAIARRLAEDGAAVMCAGRSEERGLAVVDKLAADGLVADFVRTDVGVEAQVAWSVDATVQRFGRIDIVVNNAAALDADTRESPVHTEPTEVFESILRVNLLGPFWLAKHALPQMISGGRGGSVVSISSYASQRGVAGIPAYSASKGALEALTRQLAVDYAEHGIRANTVLLGSIAVPRNAALHEDPAMAAALRQGRMTERAGRPEDVAAAVAYLVSDDASFVTGTTLTVDGGLVAKAPVARVAKAWRDTPTKES